MIPSFEPFLARIRCFFEFTLYVVNKSLKIPNIFSKKSSIIRPYNKSGVSVIVLVLSLLKNDNAREK